MLTCLACLHAKVLACLRVSVLGVLGVLPCLRACRAYVLPCLACLRARVLCVLMASYDEMFYFLTCLHAGVLSIGVLTFLSNYLFCLHKSRLCN